MQATTPFQKARFQLSKILLITMMLSLAGCATQTTQPLREERNSQLTQGSVQMNLIAGKTTKAEVLEKFGAPNVTTRDSHGNEVWTYQRAGQIAHSSTSGEYFTVILFGQSSANASLKHSSRMFTLIIKFDATDTVLEFKSRESNF